VIHRIPSKKMHKFLVGVGLAPTLFSGEGLGQAQGLPLPYFSMLERTTTICDTPHPIEEKAQISRRGRACPYPVFRRRIRASARLAPTLFFYVGKDDHEFVIHCAPSKKMHKFLVGVGLAPTIFSGEGLGQAQGLPLPNFAISQKATTICDTSHPIEENAQISRWGRACPP